MMTRCVNVMLACVVCWWCVMVCVVSSHGPPPPPSLPFNGYPDKIQTRMGGWLSDMYNEWEPLSQIEVTEISDSGHPRSIIGWGPRKVDLGQVTGVSIDPQGRPVIFHRGPRIWDYRTFNETHHYRGDEWLIDEDLVLVLDPETGTVLQSWGAKLFLMPHGITVDQAGNTWLTDVALHQVFKFEPGSEKPELVLGEARVPGSDSKHFCKPTSVAVASSGDFYVADGYCNGRVMRYGADGGLKQTFGHPGQDGRPDSLYVPHGLALDESVDALCIADRENKRVVCVKAGVIHHDDFGRYISIMDSYERVFDVATYKSTLVAVGGKIGFTGDLRKGQLKDTWRPYKGFLYNPHSVALSGDGTVMYVTETGPNRVLKFVIETTPLSQTVQRVISARG